MPDPINWTLALPYFAAALAFGYLLGSIPFGLLLTRIGGLGDLRAIGSGNIGTTNVLRTGNKGLAALTLAADILKGTIAVAVGLRWGMDTGVLAGLGAFLGHLFPVWLKFRGGKGVATYIGVLLGLAWPAALIFCATWLMVAFLARYSFARRPGRERADAGRARAAGTMADHGALRADDASRLHSACPEHRQAGSRRRVQNWRDLTIPAGCSWPLRSA